MTSKIAIIGAGISGLTIATKLQEKGIHVQVFDKGKGVGGRMSSRRTDWGYIDHGTQYFGLTNPEFHDFINIYGDILKPWQGSFAVWKDGNFQEIISDKIKYVPIKAMNNLCKYLGADITVKLETKICKLVRENQEWTLIDDNDHRYPGYDFVIVTAPPSQTANLLSSHTPVVQEIKNIEMLPCYSLMIIPCDRIKLPFDGVKIDHPVLGWISNNDSKPLREDKGAIVIQSNFNYAQNNLETDREEVSQVLLEATAQLFDLKFSSFKYKSLHLWRYAIPAQSQSKDYFYDQSNGLGVCGDWCSSGKVEGAFASANALANILI